MSILNNVSLTFNLTVKAVKFWLKGQGLKVLPLVEEWVNHFFGGSGEEKTLPKEYIEETKEAVIASLELLQYCPSWNTRTARVGSSEWHCFFTSLAGVIGTFNYELNETKEGLHVKCWDSWDFNTSGAGPLDPETGECINFSGKLYIDVGSKVLRNTLLSLASRLGIKVREEETFLYVDESELVTLNKGRTFITRWEFPIKWEEISFPQNDCGEVMSPNQFDWTLGGIPKWWIEKEAMLQAVRKLGLYILRDDTNDEYLGIKLPEGEILPLNWDSIILLRNLPEGELENRINTAFQNRRRKRH